ncbi:PPE family protein [Mycobacterium sp. 852002-40037_SCH5390672]|uniref:PPE family protein n=1 Tax=Mycobacterium sp. 852002-40037_SCH5390672 TaxID=1834089 RepID=UPI000805930F|nr:PPE family protein [Mycobacterium sp. 852002-40037_SCH5390672]OBB99230.1 ribulose phosphate epimerase [Mycobacterium sp. 852002-40037_SCH5390672]
MDFGLLPPEINSGRMYTGPGPGPLLAAAAAWDELAVQLHSSAASYTSVISGLTSGWQGPSSAAMAAAAAPYAAWMSATAVQVEQTALQAKAAVAAYETAFAATVPPPVIAANRTQLMALIATNFFGQNTPAIMTTQAHYIEMWAQDAAAMYGYAGSSAMASQLTPFTPAPQTTNSDGTASQAAATAHAISMAAGTQTQSLPQLMSATPQALQSLAAPMAAADPPAAAAAPPSLLSSLDSFITGPLSPASLFTIPGVPYLLGIQSYLTPQAAANLTRASENFAKAQAKAGLVTDGIAPRMVSAPISAGMGRAGLVGGMSVPQGWASEAPAIRTVVATLPESSLSAAPAALAADGQGSLVGNMALSSLAGRAMVGTGGTAARSAGMGGATAVKEATTANIFVIPEGVIPEADE